MSIFTPEQLQSLAGELASPACTGYLQRPLPCELDDRVAAMLDAYVKGATSAKSEITKIIGTDQTWGLLAYAERMAILSVRRMSREPLEKALLALVVEGFRWDAREDMLILSLINHSAVKVGADPRQLFEDAARHASSEVAQYFREFVGRRPEDKSIQAMGYSEETTPEGFSYARNW
jgi:hypothetical protein